MKKPLFPLFWMVAKKVAPPGIILSMFLYGLGGDYRSMIFATAVLLVGITALLYWVVYWVAPEDPKD